MTAHAMAENALNAFNYWKVVTDHFNQLLGDVSEHFVVLVPWISDCVDLYSYEKSMLVHFCACNILSYWHKIQLRFQNHKHHLGRECQFLVAMYPGRQRWFRALQQRLERLTSVWNLSRCKLNRSANTIPVIWSLHLRFVVADKWRTSFHIPIPWTNVSRSSGSHQSICLTILTWFASFFPSKN